METFIESDARLCEDLGPGTTGSLIQEEMISNLVQFLQAKPYRYIMCGIIKEILEELNKCNVDNLDASIKFSEYIGTITIQTFGGGDMSPWTTFCATLANNIQELTFLLRRPIYEWEAEFEKLSLSENSDRLQREINAHAIYRHVCIALKSLMEKLEKPKLNNSFCEDPL